jgi:acid phosphatase
MQPAFAIAIYTDPIVAAHLIRMLMWPATPQLESFMAPLRTLIASVFVVACAGCAAAPEDHSPDRDLGLLWVKHAAEYTAVSTQVYKMAEQALPRFIEDTSWSALPGQSDAAHLPTAIIIDVDETAVGHVDFQIEYERPFANWKLNSWSSATVATPIPGVQQFSKAAQDAGVTLFFLTNRPCQPIAGIDDPCPQKQTTLDDISEAGIETDANHVMLSGERPEWSREKLVRRELIARTHRIIMLIGDDISDFIPCVRKKPAAPCTEAATAASRQRAIELFRNYWGNGWYILPNPMHGSWTSVR